MVAAAVEDLREPWWKSRCELQHVLDLVAAHLALLEPIAGGNRRLRVTPRRAAAHVSLGFQMPAHARIRGARHARGAKRHAQVVVVKLGAPARVFVVLRAQRLHGLGREAREAADVATHLIAQRLHRIGGVLGGVEPALECRDPEADIEPRERMTPVLAANWPRAARNPRCRRWGQQRPDDRKAQPRQRSRCSRSSSLVMSAPRRPHRRAPLTRRRLQSPDVRLSTSLRVGATLDYLTRRGYSTARQRSACATRSSSRSPRSVPAGSAATGDLTGGMKRSHTGAEPRRREALVPPLPPTLA
jgi:hypothetical protein